MPAMQMHWGTTKVAASIAEQVSFFLSRPFVFAGTALEGRQSACREGGAMMDTE